MESYILGLRKELDLHRQKTFESRQVLARAQRAHDMLETARADLTRKLEMVAWLKCAKEKPRYYILHQGDLGRFTAVWAAVGSDGWRCVVTTHHLAIQVGNTERGAGGPADPGPDAPRFESGIMTPAAPVEPKACENYDEVEELALDKFALVGDDSQPEQPYRWFRSSQLVGLLRLERRGADGCAGGATVWRRRGSLD
jgi:hypothetical protein